MDWFSQPSAVSLRHLAYSGAKAHRLWFQVYKHEAVHVCLTTFMVSNLQTTSSCGYHTKNRFSQPSAVLRTSPSVSNLQTTSSCGYHTKNRFSQPSAVLRTSPSVSNLQTTSSCRLLRFSHTRDARDFV